MCEVPSHDSILEAKYSSGLSQSTIHPISHTDWKLRAATASIIMFTPHIRYLSPAKSTLRDNPWNRLSLLFP